MNAPTFPTPHLSASEAEGRPYWERGDGFDQRDPSAPAAWLCGGCDGFRETARAFCACCEGVTESYRLGRIPA